MSSLWKSGKSDGEWFQVQTMEIDIFEMRMWQTLQTSDFPSCCYTVFKGTYLYVHLYTATRITSFCDRNTDQLREESMDFVSRTEQQGSSPTRTSFWWQVIHPYALFLLDLCNIYPTRTVNDFRHYTCTGWYGPGSTRSRTRSKSYQEPGTWKKRKHEKMHLSWMSPIHYVLDLLSIVDTLINCRDADKWREAQELRCYYHDTIHVLASKKVQKYHTVKSAIGSTIFIFYITSSRQKNELNFFWKDHPKAGYKKWDRYWYSSNKHIRSLRNKKNFSRSEVWSQLTTQKCLRRKWSFIENSYAQENQSLPHL